MSNVSLTPGVLYILRYDSGRVVVMPVDEFQGITMKRRGYKHVYEWRGKAAAIARRLNREP